MRLEEEGYDVLVEEPPDAAVAENVWEFWQETLLALVCTACLARHRAQVGKPVVATSQGCWHPEQRRS